MPYIVEYGSRDIIPTGGVLVSTWKQSISGMRRTSVGLLNHPTNKINAETEEYLAWLLKT